MPLFGCLHPSFIGFVFCNISISTIDDTDLRSAAQLNSSLILARLKNGEHGEEMLVFVKTMSLEDIDIVTLSDGHTLGAAHKERFRFEGPWTPILLIFDNSYFT
ncbi:hypothetical protein M8C21_028832 [Ambrosia artemisiifolia]|uniref:Uncharacterized protein n=1 Tax=Ambrosia artemisiifolia TaxID=4212 RepID=A0AAD5C9W2_AMBAR|nr:hypothetical protein M8C21_028832 [Ambrosia artemisiifolia]